MQKREWVSFSSLLTSLLPKRVSSYPNQVSFCFLSSSRPGICIVLTLLVSSKLTHFKSLESKAVSYWLTASLVPHRLRLVVSSSLLVFLNTRGSFLVSSLALPFAL